MRVLVCGSRHLRSFEAFDAIAKRLFAIGAGESHTLIQGCAQGVDRLARDAALRYSWRVRDFPADWHAHGRAAGPIRNQRMLDEGKPDLVIAFHTDPGLGRGTADMVRRARAAGVPVEVVIL